MIDPTAAAYALLLGMVAAFNPCGFALLPAYITVLVTGSADESVPRSMAVRRALLFGLAMSLGFMVVFTAFGLLFGLVSLGLQGSILPYVSYVTMVLGVILVWLGVVLVRGGELKGPGLRLNSAAPKRSFWSQTTYGAAYAIASLTCTIGLFLGVVAEALRATNPVGAIAPFLIYGLGMGTSIVLVSLLAALAGSGVASALRNKTPVIMRMGGALMIVAGLYVFVFGLAEVLPQFGIFTLNPVLLATAEWQASVVNTISGLNSTVLVIIVAVTLAVVVAVFVAGRREPGGASVTLTATSSAAESPKASSATASSVKVASADTLDAVRSAARRKQ